MARYFLFEPGNRFEALLTIETYDGGSDIGKAMNANDPGFLLCEASSMHQ
jgi:hypothetical protein